MCLWGDNDDEDCTTMSPDVQTVATVPINVSYTTTSARQTGPSSKSSVISTSLTTPSTTLSTSTTTHGHRPSPLPSGQVIYQVVGTTRAPFLGTTGASSLATDAAVESVPDFVNPVPMNIGLIVGVALAIAVLLFMLAYVIYKCVVAGHRPRVARGVVDCAEKTALGVGHDLSPPHHHAPQFTVNGRPPPLLTDDSLTPRTKKDVKEWYV